MRKGFTKNAVKYMLISAIVVIIAVFAYQTITIFNSNNKQSSEKLEAVKQKLDSNSAEIDRLTKNVGDNNLAKARAFADMLVYRPEIADTNELLKLCEDLMVSELHIIDEKGIITSSSITDYIGFDMGSGEQSKVFLDIIDDPSKEIVQEPQKNSAAGVITQYIGVARKDAKGLVQVGIQPTILDEALAGNATDVVLADFDYGKNGYVFAIDKESNEILAHKNKECIGKKASEIGFPEKLSKGRGKGKIDGTFGYYNIDEYGDILIGTMLPGSEFFIEIIRQAIIVCLAIIIINIIMIFMINRYVSDNIVTGIVSISESMRRIAEGDYSVKVQEFGNDEFQQLSNNINIMVSKIQPK